MRPAVDAGAETLDTGHDLRFQTPSVYDEQAVGKVKARVLVSPLTPGLADSDMKFLINTNPEGRSTSSHSVHDAAFLHRINPTFRASRLCPPALAQHRTPFGVPCSARKLVPT